MTPVSHGALELLFRTRFSTVILETEADPKGILMSKLNFKNLPFYVTSNVSRLMLHSIICGAAIAMVASSVGCSTFRALDETAALTYRDYVWAKRAYNLRYGNCDRPYAEHFRNGFCEGYADVSQGGDGYVPALPPDDYRGYEFQSADGAKCVDAWFEGYPAGVAAAKQDKSGSYHDVMISRMIEDAVKQEKTDATLPSEVSVVKGDQKRAQTSMTVRPGNNQPIPISPIDQMPSIVNSRDLDSSFTVPTMPPAIPAKFRLPPVGPAATPFGPGEWDE